MLDRIAKSKLCASFNLNFHDWTINAHFINLNDQHNAAFFYTIA